MKTLALALLLSGFALPALAKPRVVILASTPFHPLRHEVLPEYPSTARTQHVEGDVQLLLRLSSTGKVEEVVTADGDRTLADAARKAALQWTFAPPVPAGQPTQAVHVPVQFRLDLELPEVLERADGLSIAHAQKSKDVANRAAREKLASLITRPNFLSKGAKVPGPRDPAWSLTWHTQGRTVNVRVSGNQAEVRDEDRVWSGTDPKTLADLHQALAAATL